MHRPAATGGTGRTIPRGADASRQCRWSSRRCRPSAAVATRTQPTTDPFSVALNRFLQLFCGAESDFLARLDFDRLAGGRIAPHTSSPVAHLQNAETDEAQPVTLLEVLDDGRHELAEHRLGLLFRDFVALRKLRRKVLQ